MLTPIKKEEIEQAVLGAIIIDESLLNESLLIPSDFYNVDYQEIFKSITEMRKEGEMIDLITLRNKTNKDFNTLSALTETYTSSSAFKDYEKILIETSEKRQIRNISTQVMQDINNELPSSEIVASLINAVNNIEDRTDDKVDMNEHYEDTLTLIDNIQNQKGLLMGLSFGSQFSYLDRVTGGLIPGKIYRIGGGSNIGKSWLLYNIIISCLSQNARVSFFALENNETFTLKNLFGIRKKINTLPEKLQENKDVSFSDEALWFASKDFYIETKCKTLSSIFKRALKNKSEIIFIDYIQAYQEEKRFGSKEEKLSDYALRIQDFANKYNITVVDLSQLSNEVKRGGSDASGSDEFKGSSALKESADVGIHIFASTDGDNGLLNKRIIKITKNRLGPGVGSCLNYIMDFEQGGRWVKDFD